VPRPLLNPGSHLQQPLQEPVKPWADVTSTGLVQMQTRARQRTASTIYTYIHSYVYSYIHTWDCFGGAKDASNLEVSSRATAGELSLAVSLDTAGDFFATLLALGFESAWLAARFPFAASSGCHFIHKQRTCYQILRCKHTWVNTTYIVLQGQSVHSHQFHEKYTKPTLFWTQV